MSTLTNIPINSRSMNGIIVLSDGTATITDGNLTTTGDITGDNITSNSFSTNDIILNGSLEIPLINDISVSTTGGTQMVSLYNRGETYLAQDVHMNKAYSYSTPTTGYEITNKSYVDSFIPIRAAYSTGVFLPGTNPPTLIKLDYIDEYFAILLPPIISRQIGDTFTFYLGKPLLDDQVISIGGRLETNQFIQTKNDTIQWLVDFTRYGANSMTFVAIRTATSTTEPCWMISNINYEWENVFLNNRRADSPYQINNTINTWNQNNTFQSTLSLAGNLVVDTIEVTPTELSYLSGVTSNIQDQLSSFVTTAGDNIFTGTNTFENQVVLQTDANFNFTANTLDATIANQYFDIPSVSNNSSVNNAYPYAAITGWTFSNPSPAVNVIISRGSTAWNSSQGPVTFPILTQTQYITTRFTTGASTINISQSITFTQTGDYILQFYTLGPLGFFNSVEQTITASIAGVSFLAITTESVWAYQKVRFNISDISISYTLLFTAASTSILTQQAITLYGVEIKKCVGVNVSDGGQVNNQLIAQDGITTSGLYCRGNIDLFGQLKMFGSLQCYTRYSSATTVISNSLYGSNPIHTGIRNTILGVNACRVTNHLTESIVIGFDALAASFSNITNSSQKILAIGNRCLRAFSPSSGSLNLQNLFIGHDAGALLTMPTSSVHQYNCVVGSDTFKRAASTNIQYNALFGHNIMGTTAAAASTIQGNSVFGNNSFQLSRGANNTSCGYNNFTLGTNTATDNNCFFGSNVCNTQSGASNVMTNCSFFGSNTDVSVAGNYSNSTCLGYNSRITTSNQIILGTISEVTYPMGGLTIPVSTILTILGNISANSLTVTPTQLSFLNQVTANQIPTSAISGYGTGFLTTSSNATITGTYTFSTNPVLNSGALPTSAIQDMGTRTPSLAAACSFFGNLAGNAQLTTTTTGNHNSGFGIGTLKDNSTGDYNTAVGSKAGFTHDAGDYSSYFGYFAGGANSASNATILGANSITTQNAPDATIVGANNNITSGNTNSIILGQGNTISGNNCGIIGYGITNNTADRIHIGNATQTVYIENDLIVNDELRPTTIFYKQYYASMVNPTTLLNGNTIAPPLYEFNKVNIGAGNLFLPLSSEVEVGTILSFRRVTTVSGSLTVSIQTGSGQAILGRNSITPVTVTVLINVAVYVSIIYLETNVWAILA